VEVLANRRVPGQQASAAPDGDFLQAAMDAVRERQDTAPQGVPETPDAARVEPPRETIPQRPEDINSQPAPDIDALLLQNLPPDVEPQGKVTPVSLPDVEPQGKDSPVSLPYDGEHAPVLQNRDRSTQASIDQMQAELLDDTDTPGLDANAIAAMQPGGEFQLESPAIDSGQQPARVTPTPSGELFAPATQADHIRAARDAKDEARNASAGRTDMLAGDGELFAGTRPEQARFTRSQQDDTQPAVQRVQTTVDTLKQALPNAPEIVIAHDMHDEAIPQPVRDYDAQQRKGGASGEVDAFYYQGKVCLNAANLKTDADVARAVFHEVLGHHGLRGAFGEALNPLLDELADVRVRDIAAKRKEYGLPDTPEGRRRAAEEVLASMAEATPDMGWVKRAIAAIRTWLRKAGLNLTLSDNDLIAQFILPAREFVTRGEQAQSRFAEPVFNRGKQGRDWVTWSCSRHLRPCAAPRPTSSRPEKL